MPVPVAEREPAATKKLEDIMERSRPQYYAITAYDEEQWYDRSGQERRGLDWFIISGPHNTRAEAEAEGLKKIGPELNEYGQSNMIVSTKKKNLCVVAKSSLRKYRLDLGSDEPDMYPDDEPEDLLPLDEII